MAERPIAVNFGDVGPNDGLDGFRSEADISLDAQPVRLKPARDRRTGNASGVALAARNSRYLRVWAAALATVFLVVAIGASLLMPSFKQEDSADTPRARDVTAQPQPQQLDNSGSARAENTAANDAALTAPASRTGASAVTPPQPRSTASRTTPPTMTSGGRQSRSNASRASQQRAAQPAATASRQRQAAAANARSRAAIVPPQVFAPPPTVAASRDAVASDEQSPHTVTERDDAQAVTASAQVTATTSIPDSPDLAFRWSAPAGEFADPTARETTFVCPNMPQSVPVTVTVRNANGAEATNTVTVRCVASQK